MLSAEWQLQIQIGVIGGSGLYEMAELTDREERHLDTPFGEPSGPYVIGTLAGGGSRFWPGTAPAIGSCRPS